MLCVHTENVVTKKVLTYPSGVLWEMPSPIPRGMRRTGYKSLAD